MSVLYFCWAFRRELSSYFVGHRTMYFPRYIVVVLWWIFSLFCGNTRSENTGCSFRSLTLNLMWPIVVLSGRYWPFRTDECLLWRIHIRYFFYFKSFMTCPFEALIFLNKYCVGGSSSVSWLHWVPLATPPYAEARWTCGRFSEIVFSLERWR